MEPLVALVGHDDATQGGVAADQRSQEGIHAGGLAGTGVTGKKEVPVGLVARPPEAGKNEDNSPPVGDDLSGRISDKSAMVGEEEKEPGEHTNQGPDNESPRHRQTACTEHPNSRDQERERQRERRP